MQHKGQPDGHKNDNYKYLKRAHFGAICQIFFAFVPRLRQV